MIPKKIHYCWFGRGNMPELAVQCINSWKRYLSDYELILWNEDNFDININDYVREAYEKKKYAFVTDYVRLYTLYHYGGIYMDTDVEILKSLDKFRVHRAFTGCQEEKMCVTGLIGAEKNHPWIKRLLDYYDNKKFILKNGKIDKTPNTAIITQITIDFYGWVPKNEHQVLEDDIHIYPADFFCAKDWRTGSIFVTEQTYAIHHFAGSWITDEERKISMRKEKIKKYITKFIGEKGFDVLLKARNNILNTIDEKK
ncbi:glycosyltransferase [Thermoanaerobacterium thermosaccharolyticum]|uniref:glycosyltransferase family 32 protein n=1 Tax=Thermoanaerobacterium thermosaccharolyticum TaxID=1517 RepID=UPI003DA9397E